MDLDASTCCVLFKKEETAAQAGDASASASGDGRAFAAAWHKSAGAQTTQKIARLVQREAAPTTSALSCDQKNQAGTENVPQKGLMACHVCHTLAFPTPPEASSGCYSLNVKI
jgi:hypothetical protein